MAHYAKINKKTKIVEQVIVATPLYILGLPDHEDWIQTSYNTAGGKHINGGTPLRKNYAGIGYKYDVERDAFIPPKPFDSWLLNEETCLWEPPVPYPYDDKNYVWDEENKQWVVVEV